MADLGGSILTGIDGNPLAVLAAQAGTSYTLCCYGCIKERAKEAGTFDGGITRAAGDSYGRQTAADLPVVFTLCSGAGLRTRKHTCCAGQARWH